MKNKWKHKISFKHFWNADISVEEKAKKAAKLVAGLKRFFKDDIELEEIVEQFEDVSGDGTDNYTVTQDFDDRMFDLYDWADANRVWITTH